MRKSLFLVALAGLLVLLYAAAGYWLAPRFVLDALQKRASELGAALRVERVRTDPFALSVDLAGVELAGSDGRRFASARGIHVDLAWSSLWGDAWTVQRAAVQGPQVEWVLHPGGLQGWPRLHTQGGKQPAPALRVQALSVSDGTLHFVDRSRAAAVELTLHAIGLELHDLATLGSSEAPFQLNARIAAGGTLAAQGSVSLQPLALRGQLELADVPLEKAWQLAAPGSQAVHGPASARASYAYTDGRLELHEVRIESAQLAPGGSVSARGKLDFRPFSARLELDVDSIPLALAQRFLPASAAVKIASGSLSGKGTLNGGEKVTAAYQGSAQVRELRLEERASGERLLAWKLARTQSLKLELARPGIEIGELLVQAPQARLIIAKDGSINLAALFKGGGNTERPRLQAALRRLRIEDGTLDFADHSLDTPFAATLRELAGTLTGFSTAAGSPALVELAGRVDKYGSVRIRGDIDLDRPQALADIKARFRNVDLAQLTPYVVKFAGYRVRSGRVSADLRYQVHEGRLTGSNQLVFQHIELGEKVQRAGAADLPLELAVALLADPQGRINLDIPVRGDLSDPKFDFGGLVARALRNVLGKIVSAPFRALAGLLGGGGEELGAVRFAPGSAALAPPEEESVAKVAQALGERPQLSVTVRGTYDPERDPAALRARAVRREIARRAGFESAGPLDFADTRTLHAAENLYLARVGNRLQLQALRERAPHYGAALVDALAAQAPLEQGAAEKLASARADAVRAALLAKGVDASRVALEPPAAQQAEKEGIAAQLALTSAGQASAGASR